MTVDKSAEILNKYLRNISFETTATLICFWIGVQDIWKMFLKCV
jgi:hypothetical protein